MDLTPRDLFILKKAYSTFKKNYESPVKENIKNLVLKTEPIKADTLSRAYDMVKSELLVDSGNLLLLNIDDVIHPVRKKERIVLDSDYKFIQELGEEKYKLLGEYDLLSQTDILKNFGITKKMTSKEKTSLIYEKMPYRLQLISDIVSNSYFSAKRVKVSNEEIKEVLDRYLINEKLKKLIELIQKDDFDYELLQDIKNDFENLIRIGENYYLNDNHINDDEVLKYFNYIESYKIKMNTSLDEIKEEEYDFLKFKVSSKKLKDFVKNYELKDLEKYGIEKQQIVDIFSPIKSYEELIELNNRLKSSYNKTNESFSDYLERLKYSHNNNIKKVIRKF